MALYFEDLSIGDVFISPARTITETDIVNYSGLSGDYNPLHTNEEYAKKTPYCKRIAHGLLGLAVAGGLGNQIGIFNGTSMGYIGLEEWTFKAPIFIGDTIHVRTTIIGKKETSKPEQGYLKRRVELINQEDDVVQKGIVSMMLKRRTADN